MLRYNGVILLKISIKETTQNVNVLHVYVVKGKVSYKRDVFGFIHEVCSSRSMFSTERIQSTF